MRKSPLISVVITAHNASFTIKNCINSIAANQDTINLSFEIILIDDRSSDNTAELALNLGLPYLIVISIKKYRPGELSARQVALDLGFKRARGSIILVTDADSVVPADWIHQMTSKLSEKDKSAIAGQIIFRGKRSMFKWIQTLDAILYFTFCRILNRLGLAGGIYFANFAFKKKVYDKIGGFKKIGFSLIEDFSFAQTMHSNRLKIRYHSHSTVLVPACQNWPELIRRIRRVSFGGTSTLSLLIGFWFISLPLLSITFFFIPHIAITLLVTRYLLSFILIFLSAGYPSLKFLLLIIFYEPLVIILGIFLIIHAHFHKDIKWGGIIYRV